MKATVTRPDVVPEGVHDAVFAGIEERESARFDDPFWKWTFKVTLDGGDEVSLTAASSALLSTQSKAFRWVTALLGQPPDGVVDFDQLVGRRCRLEVSINERGFSTVDRVLPAKPAVESAEELFGS